MHSSLLHASFTWVSPIWIILHSVLNTQSHTHTQRISNGAGEHINGDDPEFIEHFVLTHFMLHNIDFLLRHLFVFISSLHLFFIIVFIL